MIEIAVGVALLLGGFFSLVAGLGVLRLPDVLIRMHASTKAGTLGCGLVLLGAGLFFADTSVTAQVVLTFLFILLTAPIAAHMISRAALKLSVPLWQTRPHADAPPEQAAQGDRD